MCLTEKSYISRTLLAYISEHQDAQDTLEGIVEWWLVEQQIYQQMATVKNVLDELVARGLLLERKGLDARAIYRVNPQKADEISALIRDKTE
jgi:hypothetical protein